MSALALNFEHRNGTPVMSSLELAALCVGKGRSDHSNFLTKAKKVLGTEQLLNFSEQSIYTKGNGATGVRDVAYLPEREACLMAMSYSYELQAYVYDEWQKLKKFGNLPDFSNPAQAAIAWAKEYEEKQAALALVEEQKPKVEYHDKVLDTESAMTTTVIAKSLEMTPVALNKYLRDQGIQYKQGTQWFLYAEHQDKGWVKTATYLITNTNGEQETRHSMKWTEKGRRAIMALFGL